ncbi:MAG: hypothetical protein MUD00_01685 [Candidatus Pacebacteria bacterium]|jgi:plastocyanin|nr:hypothetical protein [Candidatus Paceibacterota bacterium]
MNKTLSTVILVAMFIFAGYFFVKGREAQKDNTPPHIYMADSTVDRKVSEAPLPLAPTATHDIIFSDSGFSPNQIRIKKGDTIIFKNESSSAMWPAANAHPTHREYPTTGGCLGSAFDACKGIPVKETWSFTFDHIGTWKYHDHLSPQWRGSIIVE